MRKAAFLLLFLAYVCCAHACPVSTVVSCPDVYAALVSRIKCVGSDCPKTIAPGDCMQNKLMRRVLTWTADAGIPILDDNSGGVLWNTTCAQLSDIVALSMLGRAFVETQNTDAMFFEFHTGSNTLLLRPIGCDFQRPLYSIVLLTALFTLSFILISQYMHEKT
jgi:hypothetical protein